MYCNMLYGKPPRATIRRRGPMASASPDLRAGAG